MPRQLCNNLCGCHRWGKRNTHRQRNSLHLFKMPGRKPPESVIPRSLGGQTWAPDSEWPLGSRLCYPPSPSVWVFQPLLHLAMLQPLLHCQAASVHSTTILIFQDSLTAILQESPGFHGPVKSKENQLCWLLTLFTLSGGPAKNGIIQQALELGRQDHSCERDPARADLPIPVLFYSRNPRQVWGLKEQFVFYCLATMAGWTTSWSSTGWQDVLRLVIVSGETCLNPVCLALWPGQRH